FVHDLELPGMVHGRIVRPPHAHARLEAVDVSAVEQMPGVLQVVQDGSFLGVIAEKEAQAVAAREQLRTLARWSGESGLTTPAQDYERLFNQPPESYPLVDGATVTSDPTPVSALPQPPAVTTPGTYTINATYTRPY